MILVKVCKRFVGQERFCRLVHFLLKRAQSCQPCGLNAPKTAAQVRVLKPAASAMQLLRTETAGEKYDDWSWETQDSTCICFFGP
jgi:hypothetical protein